MHFFYYGRLRVRGKENIPYEYPVIFAPNHQNALMDALAVLHTIPRQMVFLARSDIFNRPLFSSILTFLKIMPVYRMRDGFSSLAGNKEIFEKTVAVLQAKRPLVILPEGNHKGLRKLRQLKKGLARIAFQSEEATGFNLGIKIIPVGLDYSRYEKSGSELLIKYGKPIAVADYFDLYKEKPVDAINSLMSDVKQKISELMIDIQQEEYYDLVDILRSSYSFTLLRERGESPWYWNRYQAEIDVVHLMDDIIKKHKDNHPEKLNALFEVCKNYRDLVIESKVHFRIIEMAPFKLWKLLVQGILFIALSPLFLYGLINNFIPYIIPKIISKKVKDIQFVSSFKYVISLITFPLLYLIQTLLFYFLVPLPGYYSWIYLASVIFSGIFSSRYRMLWRRFIKRVRFKSLGWRRKKLRAKIIRERERIEVMMKALRDSI
jgi:1-acyl-sn-glycerol-3-phosphate acyltransferase